jgi:16S rRNA processing protein RimM
VTRAHGIKGEVSVLVLTEIPDRFEPGSTLRTEDGRELVVESSRGHRQRMLVAFEGIADRTAAETLHGAYLFVDEAEVPPPPEGSWWPHQLVGCEVVTESGRSLGQVREVVPGIANDLWVAGTPEEEVLLPALKDVVASVDVDGRRVVVRDVPGLTAPETE